MVISVDMSFFVDYIIRIIFIYTYIRILMYILMYILMCILMYILMCILIFEVLHLSVSLIVSDYAIV